MRSFSNIFVMGIISLLIAIVPSVWGQEVTGDSSEYFYYCGQRKIFLQLSSQIVALKFKAGVTESRKRAVVSAFPNLEPFDPKATAGRGKLNLIKMKETRSEIQVVQTMDALAVRPEVEYVCLVFDFPDARLIVTNEFIAEFNALVSAAEIKEFNEQQDVEVVEKGDYHYLLKVKTGSEMNALQMANFYHESPLVNWAHPNFVRFIKPAFSPNDAYYSQQWGLNNRGKNSPYCGGTADCDIDARQAWDITKGNTDIIVAIIDEGVETTHEDLDAKIVDGYDTYDNDEDPNPDVYDHHGTACAGIAVAESHNSQGIAGVGYNAKLMPIRIARNMGPPFWWWDTDDYTIAAGIDTAWKRGADVLSNSWGGGSESVVINKAIARANSMGRNGKGCVVIFAAGNSNSSVSYPARLPEVLAVGATNEWDERKRASWDPNGVSKDGEEWWGSNHGPELDVVAPGVHVWTTDRMDGAGYNSGSTSDGDAAGNYFKWFGGTSAATPHVAGIAALILSKYPELTSDEVKTIIKYSSDDQVGFPSEDIPGWDEYMGYGRVNTFKALAYADAYVNGHIVPDDFVSIQDAIDDAVSGQFVFVKAGTYNESVQMKNGVSLIGAGGAGRDISTIQVGGYYPAVFFSHIGTGTRLMGFTLMGYAGAYLYYSVPPGAPTNPPIIEENNIEDSYDGLYCYYYSNPTIRGNIISSNDYGVRLYYGCDPVMYGDSEPNNCIEGNAYRGIYARRASEPKLGRLGAYGPGDNRIVNPVYDLYATSDCNLIYAEWNWWGEDPPNSSQIYHEGGPQGIDYVPWDTTGFTKPLVAPFYAGESRDAVEHLWRGDLYVELGRHREALRELKYVLENYPESSLVSFAADILVKAYGYLGKSQEALTYLEGISRTYSGTLLERTALEFTIPILVWRGNYQRAVSRAQDLRRAFPTTEMAKHLLFELGMIYKHELGDKEKAREVFQSLISQYPEDELVALATMELNTMDLAKPREESLVEAAPTSFTLLQNYPNPGNPSTTITFTLPRTAHVTLEIYNLLGQRVRTLVDGAIDAGSHTVVWDGRDELGSSLSSGVYLYRLRAVQGKGQEDFVRVKKMVLVR